jgi:transcriptional regulator with XRE-family HTH domain
VNVKKLIGDNVKGYRKRAGWTQVQLSVRAGINSEHLSRLENGSENMKVETLQKLADELDVELYELFIKDSYKSEN